MPVFPLLFGFLLEGSLNVTENDPFSLVCQNNCTDFNSGSQLYIIRPDGTKYGEDLNFDKCPMVTNLTVSNANISKDNGIYQCIFHLKDGERENNSQPITVNVAKLDSSQTTTTTFPPETTGSTTSSSTTTSSTTSPPETTSTTSSSPTITSTTTTSPPIITSTDPPTTTTSSSSTTTTSSSPTTTSTTTTSPPIVTSTDPPTTTSSKIVDKSQSSTWKGIIGGVMVLLCIVIIYFSYFRRRPAFSGYDEMAVAFKNIEDLNSEGDNLGYSQLYEVSAENLELLDYLGDGNYGYVRKGELNISSQWQLKSLFKKSESKLSCAVKRPCSTGTVEHLSISEQMLWDELKVMCAVGSHPHIVTLIGAITIKNELSVIVELCENNSLKEYMKRARSHFVPQYQDYWTNTELENYGYMTANGYEPPETQLASNYREPINKESWEKTLKEGFTTSHLISFGMQIAQGMEYLVSRNCIHRDLAARNVLVTGRRLCKIADFGFAKALSSKNYYKHQNQKDLPVRWMAPEAVQHATAQSDIWSFGILLYELFSLGGVPYQAVEIESLDDFFTQLDNGLRCPKPSDCHPDIYAHMLKCWSHEPSERPLFSKSVEFLEVQLYISSKSLLNRIRREFSIERDKQNRLAIHRAKCHNDGQFSTLSQRSPDCLG